MKITMTLPDDIAQCLQAKHPDLARHMLECWARECYRSRILSAEQVQQLLGFASRLEVYALLTQHNMSRYNMPE